MADESLGREIKQLRADLKDDLGEIKAELGKLLPRELYEARHDALVRRVDTLERDTERAEEKRKDEAKQAEAERVAARRWAIASVVLPLVSVAVVIILGVT